MARSSKAPVAQQLKLEQIAFWDEKHSECKLGYASKHEYVMPNTDGSYTRRPRTQPKFDKEARFCLGVGMKQVGNSWVGHRFAPFEYTADVAERIHGINERIAVPEYLRMINFYETLLMEETVEN